MSFYIPLYGHEGPKNVSPRINKTPTDLEVETYYLHYLAALKGELPYEPTPTLLKRLGLPLPPLLIESTEILRPPSVFFGHHNQVITPTRTRQLTVETTRLLKVTTPYEPLPPSGSKPISHLIELIQTWGIPLEAALYFLVWENRRLGYLIYHPSQLEELNDYLDYDGKWRMRLC